MRLRSCRVVSAIGLILMALPLHAQPGHVHTSRTQARVLPLPKDDGVWHFVVYGDRTGGPREGVKVLAQAVEDTNLLDPDLVMTVGDLIQGYNSEAQWMDEMTEFKTIMNRLSRPWYPVAGNHDIYWRGSRGEERPLGEHEGHYEKHFGPLWYWFGHKNAAFVVLYSDEGPDEKPRNFNDPACHKMSAEQRAWLTETLEKTGAFDHVFVFLHHPRWFQARYSGSDWEEIHPILATAGNVTACFAGHIHQMTFGGVRDGIAYYTLATTGGHIPGNIPPAGYLHHLNVVTVRRSGIAVATLPVGAVMDPRQFTAERLDDMAKLRGQGIGFRGERLLIRPDGAASGSFTMEVKNPTRRPVEFTLRADPRDSGIRFLPQHHHRVVEPGESASLEFAYRRGTWGLSGPWSAPRIVNTVEYLTEGARLALPDTDRILPLAAPELPAGSADPGVLVLDGKGATAGIRSQDLPLPDGPFTLEGWLLATRLAGRRPFLAKTERSEYALFVNDGVADFSVHIGGRYVRANSGTPVLEAGRWHHLAGVFDGKEVRLYVDGALVARAAGEGPRTRNDLPFFVGADPNRSAAPVDPFPGSIDEVRLSSVARYEGDRFKPSRFHEPDRHTVLLLHLDEDLGPFLRDSGPASHHAQKRGTAHCGPLTTSGN